MKLANHMFVT